MKLQFKPVTADNRAKALALTVHPAQAGFVETVADCLAEADAARGWHPVLLYDTDDAGGEPVGFAMYKYFGLFPPLGRAWLDRLLIDAHFQGRGYGTAAVTALCAQMRAEYGCRSIYLSVYEDNDAAIRLYERAGFAFNGKRDLKGEKVMVARD